METGGYPKSISVQAYPMVRGTGGVVKMNRCLQYYWIYLACTRLLSANHNTFRHVDCNQLDLIRPHLHERGAIIRAVYHVRERRFISTWCKHPIGKAAWCTPEAKPKGRDVINLMNSFKNTEIVTLTYYSRSVIHWNPEDSKKTYLG